MQSAKYAGNKYLVLDWHRVIDWPDAYNAGNRILDNKCKKT